MNRVNSTSIKLDCVFWNLTHCYLFIRYDLIQFSKETTLSNTLLKSIYHDDICVIPVALIPNILYNFKYILLCNLPNITDLYTVFGQKF